ncbi:MAG: hypothetical protein LW650_14500 [Planctomycetaceae bacterium]|nr:hypothetical protein [Planctomycetaceae bacterium]
MRRLVGAAVVGVVLQVAGGLAGSAAAAPQAGERVGTLAVAGAEAMGLPRTVAVAAGGWTGREGLWAVLPQDAASLLERADAAAAQTREAGTFMRMVVRPRGEPAGWRESGWGGNAAAVSAAMRWAGTAGLEVVGGEGDVRPGDRAVWVVRVDAEWVQRLLADVGVRVARLADEGGEVERGRAVAVAAAKAELARHPATPAEAWVRVMAGEPAAGWRVGAMLAAMGRGAEGPGGVVGLAGVGGAGVDGLVGLVERAWLTGLGRLAAADEPLARAVAAEMLRVVWVEDGAGAGGREGGGGTVVPLWALGRPEDGDFLGEALMSGGGAGGRGLTTRARGLLGARTVGAAWVAGVTGVAELGGSGGPGGKLRVFGLRVANLSDAGAVLRVAVMGDEPAGAGGGDGVVGGGVDLRRVGARTVVETPVEVRVGGLRGGEAARRVRVSLLGPGGEMWRTELAVPGGEAAEPPGLRVWPGAADWSMTAVAELGAGGQSAIPASGLLLAGMVVGRVDGRFELVLQGRGADTFGAAGGVLGQAEIALSAWQGWMDRGGREVVWRGGPGSSPEWSKVVALNAREGRLGVGWTADWSVDGLVRARVSWPRGLLPWEAMGGATVVDVTGWSMESGGR